MATAEHGLTGLLSINDACILVGKGQRCVILHLPYILNQHLDSLQLDQGQNKPNQTKCAVVALRVAQTIQLLAYRNQKSDCESKHSDTACAHVSLQTHTSLCTHTLSSNLT